MGRRKPTFNSYNNSLFSVTSCIQIGGIFVLLLKRCMNKCWRVFFIHAWLRDTFPLKENRIKIDILFQFVNKTCMVQQKKAVGKLSTKLFTVHIKMQYQLEYQVCVYVVGNNLACCNEIKIFFQNAYYCIPFVCKNVPCTCVL